MHTFRTTASMMAACFTSLSLLFGCAGADDSQADNEDAASTPRKRTPKVAGSAGHAGTAGQGHGPSPWPTGSAGNGQASGGTAGTTPSGGPVLVLAGSGGHGGTSGSGGAPQGLAGAPQAPAGAPQGGAGAPQGGGEPGAPPPAAAGSTGSPVGAGGSTGSAGGTAPAARCCAEGGPGCSGIAPQQQTAEQAQIQACVCAADPYCCDTKWDDVCVEEVGTLQCAASCKGSTPGAGGAGQGEGGGAGAPGAGGEGQGEGGGAGAPGAGGEGGQAGQGEAGAGGGATGQTAQPGEIPYYTTPAELCAYVNKARQTSQSHDRFRGEPWSGEYHQTKTWPLTFAVDEGLNAAAQAEAEALSGGASPKGKPSSSGMINGKLVNQYIYTSGVDTADYTISSQQMPGDFAPGTAPKAGLSNSNGTARQALYYHDAGGNGPALARIGCGGAYKAADGTTWWVVKLAP